MSTRRSLGRQFAFRALLLLLLLFSLTAALGGLGYYVANRQATTSHLTSARANYINVIANLERRWGREAYNLKMRLESQHILEPSDKRREKVLSYLIAQGSSIEFPSLRIEDSRGELITSLEYVGHKVPKVHFLPNQESIWAISVEDERLYLVFRHPIWLGNENGYLLLFKPMDHALLTQNSYPETRLSLWWKGRPVASSEGEDGMSMYAYTQAPPENDSKQLVLPWPGNDSANAPQLLIESTYRPHLSVGQLFSILTIALFAAAITAWGILGMWSKRTLRRIAALERAQSRFETQAVFDGVIDQELRAARDGKEDEISSLADSLERSMRK